MADSLNDNCMSCSLIQIILQLAAAAWMAELAQRLCLNLTDTLSGNIKFFSHLFQSAGASVIKTESETKNLLLSFCQGSKNLDQLLL